MLQNKLTTPILKSKFKYYKDIKNKLLKLINKASFPVDQSNDNTYLKKGDNHSFYKHDWNDALNKNRPWYKLSGEKISNQLINMLKTTLAWRGARPLGGLSYIYIYTVK